ncbi:MAG: RNA-binding cell elongation regulator Jag/EloR [Chloroflexota bacterium]|nr:RNA-binding cell elongation regulator Jag/EloR [Chloroflexota bacterium]
MTRVRKFSGKTVDEATEIALDEMDVELEDVEIRVVRTGRSGILGFGGEPAEIDVALTADGGITDDDSSIGAVDVDTTTTNSSVRSPRHRGRGNKGRSRNSGRSRGRGRTTSSSDAIASSERISKSDSGGRSVDPTENKVKSTRRLSGAGSKLRSERSTEASPPIIHEKDEEAEQLVSELIDYFLGAMGVVADTYIRENDEGTMTFEIDGPDAGLLIGRRGETLQALQFIVRMVTNRQLGRKAHVDIDIEDYRERRVQMLRRLARRTAGRVGSSGREYTLEPMSPAERRIVHMSLASHDDVRTESEGEGNQRRVVIFPK